MLKRHGLFVFAFGLILSVVLGQAQEQGEQAKGATTEKQGQTQILPLPVPVEIIESDAAAKTRKSGEDEAKEREIRDLAAQEGVNSATQSMNDATQRMAKYAFWSTVIVGFGTFLLVWTLWETRKANKAAQNAVAVTRDIGMLQVRAYIGTANVMVKGIVVGETPEFSLNIKNTGQSPANRVKVRADVFLVVAGDVDRAPIRIPDPGPSYSTSTIAAGETVGIARKWSAPLSADQMALLSTNALTFAFAGHVVYRDVFEKTRRLTFKFNTTNVQADGTPGALRFCSRGNKSS